MPAQVLVMCPSCGRPQAAAPTCLACGASLPEAVAPASNGRDQILDAYQPHFEGDVGGGRKVLLSEKRLEWRGSPGAQPLQLEVGRLEQVRLEARPVWETLPFAVFALLGILISSVVAVRTAFALLGLLAVLACVLQRRYALRVELRGGTHAKLFLGLGRPKSPAVQRVKSVWESLSVELMHMGISVGSAS